MNKKIFQLVFFLIIIVSFGVIIKNYVNSIESNIEDYRLALTKVTDGEISRLAPITFHLAQDIDEGKYPMNVPLKNDLIKFRPSIKGYVYFTDKRTIEFQPDEPLAAGTKYTGKLDVKKIFPDIALKPYRFKFFTPSLTFKIKIKETVYFDSLGGTTPYINGYIIFNDYADFNKKQNLIAAYQNNKPLSISFYPIKNNQSIEFKISGIERTNKVEKVNVQWSGKAINSKINDSTSVTIASKNELNVTFCSLKYFPTPVLTIKFTDILKENLLPNSFLNISNLTNYNVDINKNEINIKFNEISGTNHTLTLSKYFESITNHALKNDYRYNFKLSEPKPFIGLADSSHYIPNGLQPNLIDVEVLNLKSFNVEITYVSDKNMMQFLQVNDINTSREIERVGKSIFNKTFNLASEIDYSPNHLTTYTINLLGANLAMRGLYCLTFSYKPSDIIYKNNGLANNENNTTNDEIIITNVFKHNIIFSNILAVAKLTTRDSLHIFVSDLNSGIPIKDASIEIFDFQQNKIATLFSNENGIASIKTTAGNMFIKVQNNSDVSYLKIDHKNTSLTNNTENSGIISNNGVMCQVEGLKPSYSPSELMQIGLILKKNGRYDTKKEHLEVKLESPDHLFLNTEISTINSTDIKLYSSKLPSSCKTGTWKLLVSTELAEFQYPFQVGNNSKLVLPVKFNLDEKKKTLDVFEISQQALLKNKLVITEITEYRESQKKKILNTIIQTPFVDSKPNHAVYNAKFDRNGKLKINLPNWTKPGMQFLVSSKIEFPNEIVLLKDTLLSIHDNGNWLGINAQMVTDTTMSDNVVLQNDTFMDKPNSIEIHLDKTEYFSGDSCQITYTSKNPEKALLTLENGTQVFYSQWVFPTAKKQKTTIHITDEMLPGFYASFLTYNTLEYNTSCKYISVLEGTKNLQIQVKAIIPKEWSPDKKIPIQIINSNNNDINYYLSLSNNTKSISTPIEKYFNQKQQNTIKNWSSLDYNKSGKITDKTIIYNKLSQYPQVAVTENSVDSESNILLGPFYLNSKNSSATHFIDAPKTIGSVNVKIIGVCVQTGKLFEIKELANIIDPINLKAHLPKYLNPDDIAEIPIEIKRSNYANDTFHIEIINIKNLDILSTIDNVVITHKNSPKQFSVKFKAKKITGFGEFQISVKSNSTQIIKDISIPILSNPTFLKQTVSTQISPQNEWQQTILPIGIKGTNTALLEISNSEIPNILEKLQNFEENGSDNIANLIDKTLPLIYLNNVIDELELKRKNSEQINSLILQLAKYQKRNGGFVHHPNNTTVDSWLTSYIGEFMLTASINGYNINEGILNKWKRYQQLELQRFKYSQPAYESNIAYLIYTLSLANAIMVNQIAEFNNPTKNRLIDRIYLANSYAELNHNKLAKSVINLDIIGLNASKLDIIECANFLYLANKLNNNELSLKLKTQLNVLIQNNINTPHNVFIALNSILKTLNLVNLNSNVQLKYQINNGKENVYESNLPLSYINIPLDFTLSKNIDVFNTSKSKLYINLLNTGSPQELSQLSANNADIQITNKYYSLDNNTINTKNCLLGDYIKQVVTYRNINSNLTQNISVSIPIPSGVELIYSNVPNSTLKITHPEYIQTDLLLNPSSNYEFVLIYKPMFKGEFIAFPIATSNNNIYNSQSFTQQSNICVQ